MGMALSSTGATVSKVDASTSAVTLFSKNESAVARTVFNDSTADLYVSYDAAASSTHFTVKLLADEYLELFPMFGGLISGAWSAVNGAARTTEVY
jgi:hypothetical protein